MGIDEEPQNVSQKEWQNNATGVSEQGWNSATAGISVSELEEMLKQMTFTRSETHRLIVVLHSRTIEESPSISGSQKEHKLEGERDNFHDAVLEEQIVSPAEVASTIGTDQDSKWINSNDACLVQTPSTIENLSEDLLLNIFIRLLAKQLAQMRSVTKFWNALLSQSSFVESHLQRSRSTSVHNNNRTLLLFYAGKLSSDREPFTAFLCRQPTNFIKLPVQPLSSAEYWGLRIHGSVNGLICSSYSASVIHIWNPSLSAVLTLPPYSVPYDSELMEIYLRFGFDPKTDDYKVIKLTGVIEGIKGVYKCQGLVKCWLPVEIYSARKCRWEVISERLPPHVSRIFDNDLVCVDGHNGHLHWYTSLNRLMGIAERIVAFDLGKETFREICPLPKCTRENMNYVGVLGGKLCVMTWAPMNPAWKVWVMEEYGVVESFVKRYEFSHLNLGKPDTENPFGFTLHNEYIVEDVNHRIVLYDPIANKDVFSEPYDHGYHRRDKIVEYVDSLVWVPPARRRIGNDAPQN